MPLVVVLHSCVTTCVNVWAHVCVCVCLCTKIKQKLQVVRRKDLDQHSNQDRTNKPENMGCAGNGVLVFMSLVCLIMFTMRKAMPPKLNSGYAREILIKAAIDFNCVVNRHTLTGLSASPSFSLPSFLCINSCLYKHLQLHAPVIFPTHRLLQQRWQLSMLWLLEIWIDYWLVRRFGATVFWFASEDKGDD